VRSADSTGVLWADGGAGGWVTVGEARSSRVVSLARVSTHYTFTYVVVLLSEVLRKCEEKMWTGFDFEVSLSVASRGT
jgi:hypothetical protein